MRTKSHVCLSLNGLRCFEKFLFPHPKLQERFEELANVAAATATILARQGFYPAFLPVGDPMQLSHLQFPYLIEVNL